ncbi:hypothetical protein ALQ64_00213 [Pseudomonas cannabina]|uniref:Uncharacterized protein n=1 Tax=Pseudomonas cannabina TaxID=86840 RepID=A0A3M3KBI8_PSECA|nr:hypothetical protein [Pseudomonas cannabina]RMN20394.1 hypothetical protein ALQ64_00213 [Pseudomonas cannabina]
MSHTSPASREHIEQIIESTLNMQRAFPKSAVSLWTKVLSAALANYQGTPSNCPEIAVCTLSPPVRSAEENTLRLEAVVDFSRYLLSKGREEETPNEFALEALVNDWNSAHNDGIALPGAKSLDHGEQP